MMNIRPDLFAGIVPFVCTAEARSFSRAATRLGVTTAAVSKAVRNLEADLGVRLLDRNSRAVVLTREGEAFVARCRDAVLNMQGARELMQRGRKEPQGELAITMPFILAPFLLPNLPRLSAQYPRLSFRINMSDRLASLVHENIDVAIRMGELKDSNLVSRLLCKPRWATVAAPSYLLRRPAPTNPVDLAGHNCLKFVGPNGKARDFTFLDGAQTVIAPVAGNLLIDHGDSLLRAAEAGMGICQVLDFMVTDKLRDGTLVEVLRDFAAEGPRIYALASPARVNTVSLRAFLRFLQDSFGDAASSSTPA